MAKIFTASINYSMRPRNSVKNGTRYLLFLNVKKGTELFEAHNYKTTQLSKKQCLDA